MFKIRNLFFDGPDPRIRNSDIRTLLFSSVGLKKIVNVSNFVLLITYCRYILHLSSEFTSCDNTGTVIKVCQNFL